MINSMKKNRNTTNKAAENDSKDNVSLIYVRKLSKEDNVMLKKLKLLRGFRESNAANVMIASYGYLELLELVKRQKSEIDKLVVQVRKKDEVYKAIKSEIEDIIKADIALSSSALKQVLKQKKAFHDRLKRAGNKIPKSLVFSSSNFEFNPSSYKRRAGSFDHDDDFDDN